LTLSLEDRPFGGLGVFLMKQFMDEVSHRVTTERGNELTLVKRSVLPGDFKEEEFDEHHG
jgi:anti-sigma regulatory factor (Ser/Thr protein kinase)